MGCGGDQQDGGGAAALDALRARHRAIARYTVYLLEPAYGGHTRKTAVAEHLNWDDARARAHQLNAQLKAAGNDRFMGPQYGVEIENYWETLSEAARERLTALGKEGHKRG